MIVANYRDPGICQRSNETRGYLLAPRDQSHLNPCDIRIVLIGHPFD